MERHLPAQTTNQGESVFRLALAHRQDAIDTIVAVMKTAASEKTRMMAAMVILDYARRAQVGPDEDESPVVVDAPAQLQVQRTSEPAQPPLDKAAIRDAKIKIIELLRNNPDKVITAPLAADKTGVSANIASACLVQLHRDGQIHRGGPGMYMAERA